MHELADTQRLLELALEHARAAGAARITGLHVVIGHAAHLHDESVRFYWDVISRGTPAEDAQLHFRYVPAEMACLACGARFAPGEVDIACPQCGGARVRYTAGEEFALEAIDVEAPEQAEPP